jgi:hypothetical protein
LERCWQKPLQTSPALGLPSSNVWPKHDGTFALLPPFGGVSRLLLLGGGGAGKTSRINLALSPWLRAFVGNRGLQKLAPSHKAARGILGETLHMANNLQGTSSMPTPHLRTQPRQQAFVRAQGRQGARIDDEFSQLNSRLLHADMYMTSVARELAWEAREQFLEATGQDSKPVPARYTDLDRSWGAMSVVVVAGDELQFPCVPAAAGLLASCISTSDEQKAAVKLFTSFTDVYKLRTQKRFTDPVLISILHKMQTQGGCKLSTSECERLRRSEVGAGGLSDLA